jgi:ketopantoate reductase
MIVIGAGRVGQALAAAARDNGEACSLVTRDAGWEALDGPPGDPILVATRAGDLAAVLERVPLRRQEDLVFVQNGMYTSVLAEHRLTGTTRGLLFFAVPLRGDPPQPGQEPSPFSGVHALAVVRWLVRVGVPARAVDWPAFTALQVEKLVWNCAFGVMCDAHGVDVGTVCAAHGAELTALVDELRQVARASVNVDLPLDWLVERLCAYSASIPTYRAQVKEWRWRDGWFVREAHRRAIPTPIHHRRLRELGYGDRLP